MTEARSQAAHAMHWRRARARGFADSGDGRDLRVLRVFRCPTHGAFLVLVPRAGIPGEAACPFSQETFPSPLSCGDAPWFTPPRELNMDGDLHVENECCGEGSILGETCRWCGGRVHRQAIYGGIDDCCEGCDRDSRRWRPAGHYVNDSRGGIIGERTDPASTSAPTPSVDSFESVERSAIEHGDAVYSVPRPGRHHDVCQAMASRGFLADAMRRQGFVTSTGRFVDRTQALTLARRAGQIAAETGLKILFSEDVW